MKLHQTGGEIIPLKINCAFWHAGTLGDICDDAIRNGQRSGNDLVFQDQAGIGEKYLLGHGNVTLIWQMSGICGELKELKGLPFAIR